MVILITLTDVLILMWRKLSIEMAMPIVIFVATPAMAAKSNDDDGNYEVEARLEHEIEDFCWRCRTLL